MIKNKKKLLVIISVFLVTVLCVFWRIQLTRAGEKGIGSPTEETTGESRVPGETVWIGENTYYVVPEDNFNPLTASDEELKKYGFLERPDDPEGLEEWRKLYVSKPMWVEPKVYSVPDVQRHRLETFDESELSRIFSADRIRHWINADTYYLKPPEGFDPLTASDEELKKYGFPERPDDPEGLTFWESLYKTYPEFVDPEMVYGEEPLTSLSEMLSNSLKADISNNRTGVDDEGASWTRIGGSANISPARVQLGCDGAIDSDGSVQYKTFYQTTGTSASGIAPHYMTAPSISPGDDLFAAVRFEHLPSGAVDIHYYFHNITKNLFSNVVEGNVTVFLPEP